MQLKGMTIMELTVGLLLSGIIVLISYYAIDSMSSFGNMNSQDSYQTSLTEMKALAIQRYWQQADSITVDQNQVVCWVQHGSRSVAVPMDSTLCQETSQILFHQHCNFVIGAKFKLKHENMELYVNANKDYPKHIIFTKIGI
jgi:hypothetical protein